MQGGIALRRVVVESTLSDNRPLSVRDRYSGVSAEGVKDVNVIAPDNRLQTFEDVLFFVLCQDEYGNGAPDGSFAIISHGGVARYLWGLLVLSCRFADGRQDWDLLAVLRLVDRWA